MKTITRSVLHGLCGLASIATASVAAKNPERPEAVPVGLVHFVPPEFPVMARANGVCRGVAHLAVSWDAQGRPTDAVVLDASDAVFGTAACEAVMGWRFAPEKNPTRYYEFRFELEGVVICQTKGADAIAAEARADEGRRLFTRSDLDVSPKALVQPMPEFADVPRGTLEAGTVVVDFIVDEEGRVRTPWVREATVPELVAPTLEKLREWRFEAPRRHGRPAVFAETWSFQFRRAG